MKLQFFSYLHKLILLTSDVLKRNVTIELLREKQNNFIDYNKIQGEIQTSL